MQALTLADNLVLNFEQAGTKIRLVLAHAGGELACRREALCTLNNFVIQHDARLFKGRLQLYKKAEIVYVILKGKQAGSIQAGELAYAING